MQPRFHQNILKYCYLTLLVVPLLLQGCSPNAFTSDSTGGTATQGNASVEQANVLFSQGKKREAAQAYYAAAARYPSPQRERVILQAAEIAASIGDARLTNSYLARIPASALDGENRARHAYVKALLALQQNNPALALSTLPNNLDNLSPALREKVKHVQQRAQAMAGGKGGSVQNVQNVQQAMVPVSVNRVAALLPQSGALGSVSQEIYRGIETARSSIASDTSVQLYDVSNGGAVAQYQQAVADGADIIVGPLDKESLAQLLAQPQLLSKPLLSLNYLTNSRNIPGALYQFGLLPEDEARQVAEATTARGPRTAIVLAPASSWGDRLAGAFRSAYQAKGGQVINIQQYPDAASNAYMQNVQNALAATQGRASMVFLAASPSQA
jgi:outer membrane PBP1 activator LpoA protein